MDAWKPLVSMAATMLGMDALWLTFRYAYHEQLFASVQGSKLQIRWIPAALVYVILPIAVYVFAVRQANTTSGSALSGAFVGFLMYAFYDFTNYATLTRWTLDMTVVDIAWGTLLCMVAAAVGFFFQQERNGTNSKNSE